MKDVRITSKKEFKNGDSVMTVQAPKNVPIKDIMSGMFPGQKFEVIPLTFWEKVTDYFYYYRNKLFGR